MWIKVLLSLTEHGCSKKKPCESDKLSIRLVNWHEVSTFLLFSWYLGSHTCTPKSGFNSTWYHLIMLCVGFARHESCLPGKMKLLHFITKRNPALSFSGSFNLFFVSVGKFIRLIIFMSLVMVQRWPNFHCKILSGIIILTYHCNLSMMSNKFRQELPLSSFHHQQSWSRSQDKVGSLTNPLQLSIHSQPY